MITNRMTVEELAYTMKMESLKLLEILYRNGVEIRNKTVDIAEVTAILPAIRNSEDAMIARAEHNLDSVVKRFTLVIDTCSLLHPQFPLLWSRLAPRLMEMKKKLVITTSVERELKKKLFTAPAKRELIVNAISLLRKGETDGIVEEVDDGADAGFADKHLLGYLCRMRTEGEFLLITQDNALSHDVIDKINCIDSVQGNDAAVSRISNHGYLARFNPEYIPAVKAC